MGSLEIKIHKDGSSSIKDTSGPINLADNKWDQLFHFCNDVFDGAYFIGYRPQFLDEEFEKTIEYVTESVFWADKNNFRIILKLKPASLQLNRRLFSKLWFYYEFPSLVYLGDENDEIVLVTSYKDRLFHEDVLKAIPDVLVLYRLTELDVVWLMNNWGMKELQVVLQSS